MADPKSQKYWLKRHYREMIFQLSVWRFSLSRSQHPVAIHLNRFLDQIGVPRPAMISTRKD